MSTYSSELLSPEASAEIYAQLKNPYIDPSNRRGQRYIQTAEGLRIQGEFDLTCRDAETGDVAWQVTQPNILTNYGLMLYANTGLNQAILGLAPSKEQPLAIRGSLSTDPTQCWASASLSWTVTPSTYTKQCSTTFTTPASTRTLGTVFIQQFQTALNANIGPTAIAAYSLLTPFRTQTTTQTVELVYRISVTPVL